MSNSRLLKGYVRLHRDNSSWRAPAVAHGRDAADVAICHQCGLPAIFSSMNVRVKLLESSLD